MYKQLEEFARKSFANNISKVAPFNPDTLSGRKHLIITTLDKKVYLASQFSKEDKKSFDNFLSIQNFLNKHGINVPEVSAKEEVDLILIQQYLGNQTLYKLVKSKETSDLDVIQAYKKVINLLLDTQLIKDNSYAAFEKEFDLARLIREYEIFIKPYLIDNLWKGKVFEAKFKEFYQSLSEILARVPKVFCFRDFQSTNLILQDSKIFVIDFQGARLALPQYDLASLLEDNYLSLSEETKQLLLDYYIDKFQTKSGQKISAEQFKKIYYLTVIQRKLHDLAIFVKANVQGNNYFMKYIPENIERLKELLRDKDSSAGPDFSEIFVTDF